MYKKQLNFPKFLDFVKDPEGSRREGKNIKKISIYIKRKKLFPVPPFLPGSSNIS